MPSAVLVQLASSQLLLVVLSVTLVLVERYRLLRPLPVALFVKLVPMLGVRRTLNVVYAPMASTLLVQELILVRSAIVENMLIKKDPLNVLNALLEPSSTALVSHHARIVRRVM
jgi:hypothetical protein